jgi:hypothetical protein
MCLSKFLFASATYSVPRFACSWKENVHKERERQIQEERWKEVWTADRNNVIFEEFYFLGYNAVYSVEM